MSHTIRGKASSCQGERWCHLDWWTAQWHEENSIIVYETSTFCISRRLVFWDQQIQASKYSNPKSMKWNLIFIKWSLYLSGKSYELLRRSGCIKLPSQSTLRDYAHHIPTNTGFSTENDQQLVDAAFLSEKLNICVLLVMDEMHIKHDLVFDKHSGTLIGLWILEILTIRF